MLPRHPTINYLCAPTHIIKESNHETKTTKYTYSSTTVTSATYESLLSTLYIKNGNDYAPASGDYNSQVTYYTRTSSEVVTTNNA